MRTQSGLDSKLGAYEAASGEARRSGKDRRGRRSWRIYAGIVSLLLVTHRGAQGQDIFVTTPSNHNTIGEYTTSGTTVNVSLVSGLSSPTGIAVSGSDIFVTNEGNATIGEYTTSGTTVNASLISAYGENIAVSGSDIFVTNPYNGTIGEYTTSGTTVNASLISGLSSPTGIAVSAVPEPSSIVLLCFGAAGLGVIEIRRRMRGRVS